MSEVISKAFDLNIENILESWEVFHAVRELIANALDEQLLTNTDDVKIYQRDDAWIIRDFGRGLEYTHLTQNENPEKLQNTNVIGRFGIGLKDAFATFNRRHINVSAKSRHGIIKAEMRPKNGFGNINTLHAVIENADDINFVGTEFRLVGVRTEEIEAAKRLFLRFSGEDVIETITGGQIIRSPSIAGNIYINGVKVAEEENFLFSYNITKLTAPMKKALNRERTNVGRTAYSGVVKSLLLKSSKKEVAQLLAKDLEEISQGKEHDELKWIDVQEHAVKILNEDGKYVFISSSQAMSSPDFVENAKKDGNEIVVIPESLVWKIRGASDLSGRPIVDFEQYAREYERSFSYSFVQSKDLSELEQEIYQKTDEIIAIFGKRPSQVKAIRISSTMRKDFEFQEDTLGCWDPASKSIIILRDTLKSLSSYAAVLVHELIHAETGYADVSRAFEGALTEQIGAIYEKLLQEKGGRQFAHHKKSGFLSFFRKR